ncbi:MAG: hypothetical protein LBS30_03475 [Planctomycetota bacterium]|jgi:hypothetical protein|nr:hypothetical protein [Planctomycetota bacterium]
MDSQNTPTDGDNAPHAAPPPLPPEADGVQRVDAEPMNPSPGASGNAGQARVFAFQSGAGQPALRPPVLSAWICLVIAWLFLGSKIPFTIFIGIPFDLVALLLGAICLSRGGVGTGVSVLFLGTIGSAIVYLIGLFRFLVIGF